MVRRRRLLRRNQGHEEAQRARTSQSQTASRKVGIRSGIDDSTHRRRNCVKVCRQERSGRKGLSKARRRRRLLILWTNLAEYRSQRSFASRVSDEEVTIFFRSFTSPSEQLF